MQFDGNRSKVLTIDSLNANVKACKYEVRGEIYLAAVERARKGKEVIYTNVGNPHALGQLPLTFNRQVLALLHAPFLLADPRVSELFPSDAIKRAKLYLQHMKGGIGAYSDSKGHLYIRQEISEFIYRQTGCRSNPENIFISNGASECVRMMLQAIIRGKTDGIMVPIPQYPLYSASISLYGGELVPYYLDEKNAWSLNVSELQRSLNIASSKGITVRALVYINPGNPTGQCLSHSNIVDLIKFCYKNRLILFADEVYQENIYTSSPFISARQVLGAMPEPVRSSQELVSFHTVSKGTFGECGLRGGYMELHNFDEEIVNVIYKLASINLSPNVTGQVALGLMVNPPKRGEPSYELYANEKKSLLESLARRARMMTDAFNSLEGITCQETSGAMYSFPCITLPPAAIQAAKDRGKSPDTMYCLELLNETGISTVPGSAFQQKQGTFHLRTTILPQEDRFNDILNRFRVFHEGFMRRYGSEKSLRSKL